jgi:hypothetical protein
LTLTVPLAVSGCPRSARFAIGCFFCPVGGAAGRPARQPQRRAAGRPTPPPGRLESLRRFNHTVDALFGGDAATALASAGQSLTSLPGEENLRFIRAGALVASGDHNSALPSCDRSSQAILSRQPRRWIGGTHLSSGQPPGNQVGHHAGCDHQEDRAAGGGRYLAHRPSPRDQPRYRRAPIAASFGSASICCRMELRRSKLQHVRLRRARHPHRLRQHDRRRHTQQASLHQRRAQAGELTRGGR